tara:strand:+ start:6644 stop:6892 length:249 start_codon:yes stop_codon:yes gene_type:complete
VGAFLGGVQKGLGDALEGDALFLQLVHELGKVDQAAGQSVQPPDHDGVALAHMVPELGEALAVLPGAGDLVRVDVLFGDALL